jgi:hypothetical protein
MVRSEMLNIMNFFLSTGTVPSNFETAVITPLRILASDSEIRN